MNGLIQRPDETDMGWQLRLSNIIYAQERLISVLRQENRLLREQRESFDLSADSSVVSMFHRRQV